jgi:uncharacterized membrane protein
MTGRLAPIYSVLWRALVVLLTVEIAAVSAMRYLTGGAEAPEVITANAFAHPFLVLHVAGGVTALLLGPLQFVRRVRLRWPRVHRLSGRVYVAACLIAAPAGLMLALGTTAGAVAGAGFAIPALLWPLFTGLGWQAALQRRFAEHREWMLRSYAITANAITLRLMLPLAGVLGYGFFEAYRVIAWLSWIVTLAAFEAWIRARRTAPARAAPEPAAA